MPIFEPYYKDIRTVSVGEEAPRAYFIPYADAESATKNDRAKSPYFKTLCGEWNFRYYDRVSDVTEDFTSDAYFDDEFESTDTVTVPRSWQTVLGRGYDIPQYTNVNYPFPVDPPHIPDENPCGVYTRDFYLTDAFTAGSVYLNFEGVDSCFCVWVNGTFIGYSTVSHSSTEFDVTAAVKPGRNLIAVLVVKWCAQSYLEDQDMYRFSGIFREVYLLSRAKNHIRDIFIRREASADFKTAYVKPAIETAGRARVTYTLADPDGRIVSEGAYKKGLRIAIENPVLWNDENPRLYGLYLACGDEVIYQTVALCFVRIEGKIFTVNGEKVKLRGVNRHDSHPVLGHTAPMDHVERDLVIFRQSNINCIRTSHYPNDPRMIELCEKYGFYMVDETDLETHGMCIYGKESWSSLSQDPAFKDAYVNRARKMFERDKNRGCVVMWSLGNESGCGDNHRAMRAYIKGRMPEAVIHYESDRWAPADCSDVVDVRSEMYTDPAECVARIENKDNKPALDKPFYLCEYIHAMGLGPGGIKEYIDAIRAHDEFMGGNVWEFCDHSVEITLPDGRKGYTYGGDFGEFPHDGNFCTDGLVYPDRTPSNGLRAVKNAYLPAEMELADFETGAVKVTSWRFFEKFDDADLVWNVECDGKVVKSGRVAPLGIAPRKSKTFKLFNFCDFETDGEYFLNVRLIANTDTPYYEAGHELGFRQFELGCIVSDEAPKKPLDTHAVEVTEDETFIEIAAGETVVTFDKAIAKIISLVNDGKEMLAEPISLNLFRAPTDNDRPFFGQTWKKWELDKVTQKTYECGLADKTDDYAGIYVRLSLAAPAQKPILYIDEHITVAADGSVSFEFAVKKDETYGELPRFGLKIVMPAGNERVEYFGCGPYEAYSDFKYQSRVGYFKTTATGNFEHYIRPQENSSHCDTRYAFVGDLTGHGLAIMKYFDTEDFSFCANHFDPADLAGAKHDYDLVPRKETYVFADMRMTGIGTQSCGPHTFAPYCFTEKEFGCGIIIKPEHK